MIKTKAELYINGYNWLKRGSFYIGEKTVEKSRIQRLLIDVKLGKAKIKRDGRNYHYIENPKVLQPVINYLITKI